MLNTVEPKVTQFVAEIKARRMMLVVGISILETIPASTEIDYIDQANSIVRKEKLTVRCYHVLSRII